MKKSDLLIYILKKFNHRLFLFCIILFLPACFQKKTVPAKSQIPQKIKWAIENKPETFNWVQCKTESCFAIAGLIMEGLFDTELVGAEWKIKNRLAEKFQYLSTNLLEISILNNVYWNQNQKLSADDFVRSWKNVLLDKKNSNRDLLFAIKNAGLYSAGKISFDKVGIKAKDSKTLLIHLEESHGDFISVLAHPVSWPFLIQNSKQPLSTLGPFTLEPSTKDGFYVFKKNPLYYQNISMEQIQVSVTADPKVRMNMFTENQVDFVDSIPKSYFRKSDDSILTPYPKPEILTLFLNPYKKPFHLENLRKLFSLSLDKSELIKFASPPLTLATTFLKQPIPNEETYTSDKIKTTLKTLSLENLILPEQKIILYFENNTEALELAKSIQAQWIKNLSIPIEIQAVENKMITQLKPTNYSALLFYWKSDFSLPLFNSEKSVLDQHIAIPVSIGKRYTLRHPRIQSLKKNAIEIWDFRDTTID